MWGPPHLAFLWQLLHWIRKLDSHLKHAGDGSAKKRSSIQKKLDILLISGKQKRLWPYNVTIFRVKKLPCHTALRTNSNGYFIYYSWSLLRVYTLKQRKKMYLCKVSKICVDMQNIIGMTKYRDDLWVFQNQWLSRFALPVKTPMCQWSRSWFHSSHQNLQ